MHSQLYYLSSYHTVLASRSSERDGSDYGLQLYGCTGTGTSTVLPVLDLVPRLGFPSGYSVPRFWRFDVTRRYI